MDYLGILVIVYEDGLITIVWKTHNLMVKQDYIFSIKHKFISLAMDSLAKWIIATTAIHNK
jgi:hypothetical protein